MEKQESLVKVFFKYLKNSKGQGLVEIGTVIFFCAVIGLAARESGLIKALTDTYSDKVQIALGPSGISLSETNASGNQSTGNTSGDGTSGSGSGVSDSGSGTSGSDSGNSGSGSGTSGSGGNGNSGSGSETSGSGNETTGSDNGNSGSSGTEGGNSGGGNSTPGMPAGGQTGGGSGNTGSGSTFEEKKEALDTKLKASAIPNDNNKVFNVGDIVKDGNNYKIVNNVSGTWKNLIDYNIINLSSVLKQNGQQMYFTDTKAGDMVITDSGDVYFNTFGTGYTNYPQDLINQKSNWVKLNIKI